MTNPSTTNSLLAQFNSLSQMSFVRQLIFMLILAASIGLGTAVVLWSQDSGHSALYVDLSDQDTADVIEALDQTGQEYRVENNGGLITVPSDRVRQIRMQLASQGLPRSSNRGFDILTDEQGLGTSNFIEQARYNRALEQELVQTIKQIQGIRDARVHLSIPRQNSFIRNSRQPSASIMIDIAQMQTPDDSHLSGILHLVASSVASLEPERVSIVDQRGNLLSNRNDSEFGSSSEAIRFTRNIEQNYSDRIIDLLAPIVGPGNVRAQVTAQVDYTAVETTEEIYNPATTVVRSEQVEQETSDISNAAAIPEPGSLSPFPPEEEEIAVDDALTATDTSSQSRSSTTRNFEIDRSVNLIRTVPGAIEQLSVAVLVDLQPDDVIAAADGEAPESDPALLQARIDRLTQLVQDAIGFDEARGDSVSVINEQFLTAAPVEVEELPLWQQPWIIPIVKQVLAGLAVILLMFGVLRPALKAVVSSPPRLPAQAGFPPEPGSNADLGEDQVNLSTQTATALGGAPGGRLSYDENLARAQNLVLQEPTRAARMIQNWIASE